MKKIKIMMLSLALIAVVGGALAFKAIKGSQEYCTALPLDDNGTKYCFSAGVDVADCAGAVQVDKTARAKVVEPDVCYTPVPSNQQACDGLTCPFDARIVNDND